MLGNVMPPAASAPPITRAMFRETILWVSDTHRSSVAVRLESAGFAVLTARVKEALGVLFVNRSIDAVIVNAGSSESDTLMLVRGLRAIRRDIPIFVMTSPPSAAASSIEGCLAVSEEQIASRLQVARLKPAV